MKKIGIITIYDEDNYGNRLQNYAMQEVLKSLGFEVETIKYDIDYTMSIVKPGKRLDCFHAFNENINFAPDELTMSQYSEVNADYNSIYDYIVIGSDQIWNYSFKALFADKVFGSFVDKEKRVSYAPSVGVDFLPQSQERYDICKKYLAEMKGISVREYAGQNLLQTISGRDDIEVLVDPTMLITREKWSQISKKPDMIGENEEYILKCFLGQDNDEKLTKFAEENNLKIIDIGNKNSEFHDIGPSEFLYLEKNAKLIVSDSFHACVFAILFNVPFKIYKRIDKNENNMYSRMETLIKKFHLKDIEYDNDFDESIFEIDKNQLEECLLNERRKSEDFLKRYLT